MDSTASLDDLCKFVCAFVRDEMKAKFGKDTTPLYIEWGYSNVKWLSKNGYPKTKYQARRVLSVCSELNCLCRNKGILSPYTRTDVVIRDRIEILCEIFSPGLPIDLIV